MIALQIALAAALAAWRPPVLPPPAAPEPEVPVESKSAVPGAPVTHVAPMAPPTPSAPAPAVPMIARAPLDVRMLPVPAVTARATDAAPRKARRMLYKDWRFWAVAGSLLVGSVVMTYAVTRPEPQPYTGNAPPYYVTFR
jgi:hypothetical protein